MHQHQTSTHIVANDTLNTLQPYSRTWTPNLDFLYVPSIYNTLSKGLYMKPHAQTEGRDKGRNWGSCFKPLKLMLRLLSQLQAALKNSFRWAYFGSASESTSVQCEVLKYITWYNLCPCKCVRMMFRTTHILYHACRCVLDPKIDLDLTGLNGPC